MAKWLTRRSAKPLCEGSTPSQASILRSERLSHSERRMSLEALAKKDAFGCLQSYGWQAIQTITQQILKSIQYTIKKPLAIARGFSYFG